jgi:hypothetical protein
MEIDDDDESDDEHPHLPHGLPFSHFGATPGIFPGHSRPPGGTTIIRAEGPGFRYVTHTTTYNTSPRNRDGSEDEIIAELFSTMLRNIVGDQYNDGPRARTRAPQDGGDGQPHFHASFGARLNPRNADAPQAGEVPVPNINDFLASLFGPVGDASVSPVMSPVIARLLGIPPGAGGDYVYSQAELDRIISQLMDQHQGNAPPPAAKEDIDSLPKIKVTETMVNDGVDCAVCKEDLVLDEQTSYHA